MSLYLAKTRTRRNTCTNKTTLFTIMGKLSALPWVLMTLMLKTLHVEGACGPGCSEITSGNPWPITDGDMVHVSCVLDLDSTANGQAYLPGTVAITVELDNQVSSITEWTFERTSAPPPAASFSMQNKYYIQMTELPFTMEFQMSYPSGSPQPTGRCRFPTSGSGSTPTTTSSTTTSSTPTSSTTTSSTPTSSTTTSSTTTSSTTTSSTTTSSMTTSSTIGTTTPEPNSGDICKNYPAVKAFSASGYNLYEVLCKSILFYEAQRSGDLPASNRVPWRFDSTLNDGKDNNMDKTVDLTGGWFDAGDMVKFGYPMASSTTILLWGVLKWRSSYEAAGQLSYMHDSVRWSLDYLLKCWKKDKNRFYAQVGNGTIDHNQFVRPEDLDSLPLSQRPSFYIDSYSGGSDVAADTVSALALGYMVFKDIDNTYANTLLEAAKSLFEFANNNRKPYSDTVTDAQEYYASYCCGLSPSVSYGDELIQAAQWLYRATQLSSYLTTATSLYTEFSSYLSGTPWSYDWRDKRVAVNLLMYEDTGSTVYGDRVKTFLQSWKPVGGSVPYTPKGLAWRLEWAPLRYAANVAFMSMLALDKGLISNADITSGNVMDPYKQINYILGDSGRSFVVGFGNNPPKRPHHKSSVCAPKPAACGWTEFNAATDNHFTVYGALVGGPDNQDTFEDNRANIGQSEVSCDYNAGFQSAIAGMIARPN